MDVTPENFLDQHGNVEVFSPKGGKRQRPDEQEGEGSRGASDGQSAADRLSFVDPRSLLNAEIPPREWIVRDWMPSNSVTLSYGDGGVGKTLLAQMLMTSCAVLRPWCGLAVTQCRALGLFCEDDEAELHRRQADINDAYGIDFGELAGLRWSSGVGHDNTLIRFAQDGRAQLTPRFHELRKEAIDFGARLVVVDTASDTYGGNENDRAQVRQFIGNALGKLALDIKGAVLVNAHPSRSGLSAGGAMDSGSTGWSNSARSRWALTRPTADEGEEVDADARVLTRRKSNYAFAGDEIKLRWRKGVLVLPDHSGGMFTAAVDRAHCDTVFLDLLAKCDAINFPVSGQKNASNFAPRHFAQRPDRQGYGRAEFEQALTRLMTDGRITLKSYGRPGDERRRLALATVSEATQAEASEEKSDD